ncbi:MAG TPA: S8 family serine peptidase, partial [Actinomycetota bacterium]|nr:S8 family serine peptidase [Actinomycetota bacterium]
MRVTRRLSVVSVALGVALSALPVARASSLPVARPIQNDTSALTSEAQLPPMAQLDPSLVRKLEDRPAELRVFVHAEFSKLAAAAVAEAGLRRLDVFEEIGVVYALGTARNIERLILDHRVSLVEADRAITWHTETSHDATRGRKVWADARDEAGLAIDGRGVTIAINDSGVDGRHPGLAPAVVRNLKLLCPEYLCEQPGTPADAHLSEAQWVDVTDAGNDSDTAMAGWHGTHVASIAAMRPQHSQGKYSGAAPGADLVGLSVGNVATVYGGASGMAWVLRHHAQPCGAGETVTECPPIRVINNSWGPQGGGECLPNGVVNKLQEKLVDEGVVVVWSAGNDGGDGTRNATNPPANCLTPGVISTANYNDGDSGTRDGELAANSSRAMAGAPATYPDIAAPGTNIWAACGGSCSISNAADEGESRYYTWNSGSSMAAPHVAGIVAQMLQASPALRPDQVEDILEDTAHRFTAGAAYERDPLNPGTRTSFDKGHGLVDAWEAVRRAASYGLDRRQSSLGFTLDSATEAQFSDTTSLKARLTDGVLDPIANQDVAFSLSDGTQLGRASTDMSGIAAITPPISIKPGEYELTVSFAGSPTSDPVAESAPFVVTREDSTLELELTGEGASRSLHVRLTEGDNPSTGLAGRVVELSKDGSALTTVITDQNGEARLVTPDESDAVFDASFGGDEFYLESQASTEEPSTPPWKAPIQPGAPYQALGDGTCTFNASFTDPRGNIYMGIAAHCLPNDIGMRVTTKSTGPFGTLVFWDYRYAPTWQDFGLIKIDRKMHKHYSPAMRFFGGPTAVQTGFVPGTPIYHHGYGVCTNNAEPQRPRIGILNYVNGEGPAQNVPRAPMDLPQDRGWFFAEARTCGGDSGSLFNTIDGKALGVLTWGGAGIIQWGPTFKLILEELSQKGWELELMTAPMRDPQGLAQAAVDFMTWCAEHPIGNAQDENACVRADGVSRKNHQIPEKRPEGQPGELIAHGHIVAGGPQTQFPGGSITGLLSLASGVATGEYPAPVNVDSFIIPAPPRGTPIMTRTTDNSGAGYDIDVYFHASKQGGYSVVPECATPDEDEICKVPPSMRFMEIAAYEGADLDVKVFTV